MKLSKFIERDKEYGVLSILNAEDVFLVLRDIGIKEVEVNDTELLILINNLYSLDRTKDRSEALKKFELDEFMGIKIKHNENKTA